MSLLLLFRTSGTVHALTGVAFGQGTVAARLAVLRRLAGSGTGSASVRAQLARVAPLAGTVNGTSTVLGHASCVASLAGVAAGWSRVSALILSAVGTPGNRMFRIRPEVRVVVVGQEVRTARVRRTRSPSSTPGGRSCGA